MERLRERVAEKLPFESKEPNSYFKLTGETIPGCTKDGISTEVLSAQKTTCVHEITTTMFSWPQLEFTKLNNENPLGPTVPHPNIHRCWWVLKLKVNVSSLEETQFLLVEYFFMISVTGLECYVCDNQDDNVSKCLKTIKTCEHHHDRCLSIVRWSTTPYWSQVRFIQEGLLH